MSDHGLLTTVAYKLGRDKPAFYALEVFASCLTGVPAPWLGLRCSPVLAPRQGSVAIAGAVVRWLQDNLGIIGSSEELGTSKRVFLVSLCVLLCRTSCFLRREAGGVRRDVLRLLLRSRLLRAVCSVLGAQRQRVRPLLVRAPASVPHLSPDPGLWLCYRIICGLTQFTNKSHVAFAALEAVCFQTREVNERQ